MNIPAVNSMGTTKGNDWLTLVAPFLDFGPHDMFCASTAEDLPVVNIIILKLLTFS